MGKIATLSSRKLLTSSWKPTHLHSSHRLSSALAFKMAPEAEPFTTGLPQSTPSLQPWVTPAADFAFAPDNPIAKYQTHRIQSMLGRNSEFTAWLRQVSRVMHFRVKDAWSNWHRRLPLSRNTSTWAIWGIPIPTSSTVLCLNTSLYEYSALLKARDHS